MPENKNNTGSGEQKPTEQQESIEKKTASHDHEKPDDRLTDGTNDFKNGDQEPQSEQGSTGERQ